VLENRDLIVNFAMELGWRKADGISALRRAFVFRL